jgi:hypothetical protein
VKLAVLLEHHNKHSKVSGALGRSFGDGYLCANNRFYGRARAQALEAGFKFSTEESDAYRALPLSQLDQILESKTIPYTDNVTVLETIEKKIPKQTVWDDLTDNLKANLVFHEACHAFAHIKLQGTEPALRMLLEESYANACELLAIIDAEDQVHRIFLELNCYAYMLDDRVHLGNAAKDIGLPALTRFMTLSYLHANYRRDAIDFDRVLKLSLDKTADAKTLKNLRQLSKIVFKLNPRFREVTARFYFKLHGLSTKLDGDFLSQVESSKTVLKFLSEI